MKPGMKPSTVESLRLIAPVAMRFSKAAIRHQGCQR